MVSINQETCIGCGACEATCPNAFEMKDGKAHVKRGQEKSKLPCVKEAVDGCPVSAIKA
jgi:ferredoxin